MPRQSQNEHVYYIVNTFSTGGFYSGNPVAVMVNGHLYDDQEKQQIAREFGFTNTVFYFPQDSEYPYYMTRIFTPKCETRAHETGILAASSVMKHITTHMENVPFVVCRDEDEYTLTYTEEKQSTVFNLPSPILPAGDKVSLEDSARLLSTNLANIQKKVPSMVIGDTVKYLCIPVKDAEALDKVVVDALFSKEIFAKSGDFRLVPFTTKPRDKTHDFAMRIYDSLTGMNELPSDGHAAAALGSYLEINDVFDNKAFSVTIEQGYSFERPSLVHLAGSPKNDSSELLIGGAVTVWSKGILY